MIAKAKWFSQRKYSGWGLTPNCWQGWVYIAAVIAPIMVVPYLNLPGQLPTILQIIWAVIIGIDMIDVFFHIKKDERDVLHEALAERNAMWFMVTALAAGVAYQAAVSVASQSYKVDPVIIVALFGALAVKAGTHWYLRNK